MKVITLLLSIFLGQLSYSQVKGVVIDQYTKKPIPYVNIWVENEQIGLSSEEDGTFLIDKKNLVGKFLIVTAVAYERKRIEIANDLSKIELTPVIYQLKEVVIKPNGKKREIKHKSVDASFASREPSIVAQYFPYSGEYKETPYLTKIGFTTVSRGKSMKYRIRILSVNEKGEPGADLVQQPLLFNSKYGEHLIEADISNTPVQIPSNGFFIGFEWISLKQKKTQNLGIKIKIAKGEKRSHTWSYRNGVWTDPSLRPNDLSGLHPNIQFNLTLAE